MVKSVYTGPPPPPPLSLMVTEPSTSFTVIVAPEISDTSILVGVPDTSITDTSPSLPIASKHNSNIAVPSATVVPLTKSSVNQEKVISPAPGLPIFEAFRFARFKLAAPVYSNTVSS